jgi:hypothetical protein
MEKLDRMFPPTGLENPQGQGRRKRGIILRGVRRISCQPKNPESALTFPVFVRRARERNIAANLVKTLGAAKKKSPARAVIPHVQPRPVQQPRVGKQKPGANGGTSREGYPLYLAMAAMANKCHFLKKNGSRCEGNAQPVNGLCVFHGPA